MRFKWAARMGTPVCPVSAELHSFGKLSSAVHLIFGASANGGIAFRVFFSIFFSIWLTKDGTTCMAVCPWVSPKYTKADYSAPRRNASAQRDPAAVLEMCFWSVTGGRSSCSLSMVAAFSFIFIHFSFIFHPFFSHFPHFFQFEDGLWQELALPNLWYQAMTVMWLPNFGRAAGEPRNGWKWRYPGFYNNVGIKVTNKKLSHFSVPEMMQIF